MKFSNIVWKAETPQEKEETPQVNKVFRHFLQNRKTPQKYEGMPLKKEETPLLNKVFFKQKRLKNMRKRLKKKRDNTSTKKKFIKYFLKTQTPDTIKIGKQFNQKYSKIPFSSFEGFPKIKRKFLKSGF